MQNIKRRVVHTEQHIINPIGRRLPITMLETTGGKSGLPRRTAVGGRVIDNSFWMVSEHGEHSHYVHNIKANPAVRVRIRGRWRTGTAHLLPDDDPVARLSHIPGLNGARQDDGQPTTHDPHRSRLRMSAAGANVTAWPTTKTWPTESANFSGPSAASKRSECSVGWRS